MVFDTNCVLIAHLFWACSDGYSRQFGFIGYKTEDEAFEASKYFNRSFIDTCRLQVEVSMFSPSH